LKKDSEILKKTLNFFAYTRSKSRVKNTVGPLIDDNGSLARTDKEITLCKSDIVNTFQVHILVVLEPETNICLDCI